MVRVIAVVALMVTAAFSALGGTLRVGEPQVDGTNVVLPVILEGDSAGVAALDFTLSYDPAVFEPVGTEPGAATLAARKQVQSNESSPGSYVVMMFGMNQTTIENGEIAAITLSAKSLPSSNESAVTIAQTTLASSDGFEIASEGSGQTITFTPMPPDDGDQGKDPPTDDDGTGTPKVPDAPIPQPDTPPSPALPTEPDTGGNPLVPRAPPADGAPQPRDPSGRPSPFFSPSQDNGAAPPLASTAGRLARMNAASQRLDSARATLNAPESGGGGEMAPYETGDQNASEVPVMTQPDAPQIAQADVLSKVAVATPDLTSPRAQEPIADGAVSGGQVISDSSRRGLVLVMVAVALGAIAIRFKKRRS